MGKLVSIIIRTRNEERWIVQCLRSVFDQSYQPIEVIIVDNESTDKTIEKARQFPVAKVLSCSDYLPGKALNIGIRESHGRYIACLSGHCIPVNDRWLANLVSNFDDTTVSGVYGRQEPMEFTPDADKRDLALVFGLDRKIQLKDSFFHNANSMILRGEWERTPFDDTMTNIEDRVWAKEVLGKGGKIVYDPEASVYHYHGIHQNGDEKRCANVVRILESLNDDYEYKSIDIAKLNTIAVIPVKGALQYLGKRPLVAYTIERACESKHIKRVIVSTDNPALAREAEKLGAEAPFLRDPEFSAQHVNLVQVLKHSLDKIEKLKIFPDLIVSLEITFPFRPKGLLDNMIAHLAKEGYDSVVTARRENKAIWKEHDGDIIQLDEGLTPRDLKEPTYTELKGVGCVTHPEFLRKGSLLGNKIGIFEVKDPYSHIEVRSPEDLEMAAILARSWGADERPAGADNRRER